MSEEKQTDTHKGISSIHIEGVATYKGEGRWLDDLKRVNFIFGRNGTGKTTISRVIHNSKLPERTDRSDNYEDCDIEYRSDDYKDCDVKYSNNCNSDVLVYNKDFVHKNFSQDAEGSGLKGIFTLGEGSIETKAKIKKNDEEIKKLQKAINEYEGTVKEKEEERLRFDKTLKNACWDKKAEFSKEFPDVFKGYHRSMEGFRDAILEYQPLNAETAFDKDDVKSKYDIAYGGDSETLPRLNPISDSVERVTSFYRETETLLREPILGSDNVVIADMIVKLGNHDWVRKGIDFLQANDNEHCPFCQQTVPDTFTAQLESFFNEAYTNSVNEVKSSLNTYLPLKGELEKSLGNLRASLKDNQALLDYINDELLKSYETTLRSELSNNEQSIQKKVDEPSSEQTFQTISDVAGKIAALIDEANEKIERYNKDINDKEPLKKSVKDSVWGVIARQLVPAIAKHKKDMSNCEKAIGSLNDKIKGKEEEKGIIDKANTELYKEIGSVEATAQAITKILKNHAFDSFDLRVSKDDNTSYVLVRENDSLVEATLSEGEASFLAFLYFYHLIGGAHSVDNISALKKIVVFDDPVSSLDSNTLFIVSSMIRALYIKDKNVDNNNEQGKLVDKIEQLFILSHNIFFFREVAEFLGRVGSVATFHVVSKKNKTSVIQKYTRNPISSSYALLWQELEELKGIGTHAAKGNVMRRILEHYFKMIGGRSVKAFASKILDSEKSNKYSPFLARLDSDSHGHIEDAHYSGEEDCPDLDKVFGELFKDLGHEQHYTMMMGHVATVNETQSAN